MTGDAQGFSVVIVVEEGESASTTLPSGTPIEIEVPEDTSLTISSTTIELDTDGDGIFDSEEEVLGEDGFITDPNNADTDGDTISDPDEINADPQTDPTTDDTDGDGFADNDEIADGTDPTDAFDPPVGDADGDGISNLLEDQIAIQFGAAFGNRTDINIPSDTADDDGDTLSDREELILGTDGFVTNPTEPDTDQDGIADNDEPDLTLPDFGDTPTDPTNPDTDGDGINDGAEAQGLNGGFVTNPIVADTDGDGVDDGVEITDGTNPTDPSDFIDRTNAGTTTFGFVDVFDVSAPDDNTDLCIVGCLITLFFTQEDADDLEIAPFDMKLLQDVDKNGAFDLSDGSPEVLDGNPPAPGLSGAACEAAIPDINITPCTFVEQISTDPAIFTASATVFFNSKFAIGGVKALALAGAPGLAKGIGGPSPGPGQGPGAPGAGGAGGAGGESGAAPNFTPREGFAGTFAVQATLHKVTWDKCEERIMTIIAGPPAEEISVKVLSSLIGYLKVNVAQEQPFTKAVVYEVALNPEETFVRVQVEGVIARELSISQKSIDAGACVGVYGFYSEEKSIFEITPSGFGKAPLFPGGAMFESIYNQIGFAVSYLMKGTISGMAVDEESNSITFSFIDNEAGEFIISLPRGLISASNGGFVVIDAATSEHIEYELIESGSNHVTLLMTLGEIEALTIVGTSVVPEFGEIAIIVLVISILAIIVMTRYSRPFKPAILIE